MSSVWRWQVQAGGSTDRADLAILRALEEGIGQWEGEPRGCSRSALQKLIERGKVLAENLPIRANAKLPGGARITVEFPEPEPIGLVPEERPIDVLYEDEHLLVLNKPPGLTVHPSSTQKQGTLVHALLHHVKDLSGIGGALRPGIVHRLDKDTSGALVITKTDPAHRGLSEIFSRHAIERAYWALCYGSPVKPRDRIESLIGRNPQDRKKMSMEVKTGRKAVTHLARKEAYASPAKAPFASWLEVSLETGRTHQIRVHLTGYGNSLLGDPVYGKPSVKHPKWLALPAEAREAVRELQGQALHARVLGFDHPVSGKKLRFEAEPPAAFRKLLGILKNFA